MRDLFLDCGLTLAVTFILYRFVDADLAIGFLFLLGSARAFVLMRFKLVATEAAIATSCDGNAVVRTSEHKDIYEVAGRKVTTVQTLPKES
jgi:hypothetical protein